MPTTPLIVGHRGAADLAPENTLQAFRRGLAKGADMLECDVHLSADGQDVIIHDATLDRTAQPDSPLRTGAVADLTRAQLDEVLVGEGEHIPTLAQVLDVAAALPHDPSRHAPVLVEIKAVEAAARVAEILRERYEESDWGGLDSPARVISFRIDALRTLHRLAPEVPRGYLCRGLTPEALADAAEVEAETLAIRASELREGDLEKIRDAGITPLLWAMREERHIRLAVDLQMLWIGADDPARTRRIVEHQQSL
ncbi:MULTISPECIES: glycerophosphodiester phosphodiesterase [unclassified Brachybacterium]|uniref:glycerophosphodiester phosphodiesterase n=1 Tax=unclassified Brachybacterium TaxID=2623841 RepID=UPI00402AD5CF